MYALAILRYRVPIEEVVKVTDEHRAYLRELKQQGVLVAAGPRAPRFGGVLLLRVNDADVHTALDRIRDLDPYVRKGIVQYELLPWTPVVGAEDLDKI
jgi:uncharacterized protein YciI